MVVSTDRKREVEEEEAVEEEIVVEAEEVAKPDTKTRSSSPEEPMVKVPCSVTSHIDLELPRWTVTTLKVTAKTVLARETESSTRETVRAVAEVADNTRRREKKETARRRKKVMRRSPSKKRRKESQRSLRLESRPRLLDNLSMISLEELPRECLLLKPERLKDSRV